MKTIEKEDYVKFNYEKRILVGRVVYVTDYETVNVVPMDVKHVWCIPIKDVIAVVSSKKSETSDEKMKEFLKDAQIVVDETSCTLAKMAAVVSELADLAELHNKDGETMH